MKKWLLVLGLFTALTSPVLANRHFGGGYDYGYGSGGYGYRPYANLYNFGYALGYGSNPFYNPLWCGTNHWRRNYINQIGNWLPYFTSNSYYPTNNYFQPNPYISSPNYLNGIGFFGQY